MKGRGFEAIEGDGVAEGIPVIETVHRTKPKIRICVDRKDGHFWIELVAIKGIRVAEQVEVDFQDVVLDH